MTSEEIEELEEELDDDSKQITSPAKAIRAYCIECSGGSRDEVKKCVIPKCPLFAFRFGKNPFRQKKELSEEQKQRLQESLNKYRENLKGG